MVDQFGNEIISMTKQESEASIEKYLNLWEKSKMVKFNLDLNLERILKLFDENTIFDFFDKIKIYNKGVEGLHKLLVYKNDLLKNLKEIEKYFHKKYIESVIKD